MSRAQKRQIYVALLDKGDDAWRRVDAVYEGDDSYRIVSKNEHPEERWEYSTGETVRCRTMALPSGEEVLVATERMRDADEDGGVFRNSG